LVVPKRRRLGAIDEPKHAAPVRGMYTNDRGRHHRENPAALIVN